MLLGGPGRLFRQPLHPSLARSWRVQDPPSGTPTYRPFNDRGAAIPATRMTATVQTMEQPYRSSTKPPPCDVNGQPND